MSGMLSTFNMQQRVYDFSSFHPELQHQVLITYLLLFPNLKNYLLNDAAQTDKKIHHLPPIVFQMPQLYQYVNI